MNAGTGRIDEATAERLRTLLGDDLDEWLRGLATARPEPEPGSAFDRDTGRLGAWTGWYLASTALAVAVEYLATFRELLAEVRAVHLHPPVGLLRGALEASGTALWLVLPEDDQLRQQRALVAWYSDMEDRAMYEDVSGWTPPRPRSRTARTHQAEVRALAPSVGMSTARDGLKRRTYQVLRDAAAGVGAKPDEAARLWALSSGFAHGRYWPALLGLDPVAGQVAPGGTVQVLYTVPDALLRDMTALAHRFTVAAHHGLRARSSSRPSTT